MQYITVVSYGDFELDFLEEIAECVSDEFHFPVLIKYGKMDLDRHYDPNRRQYNANEILKVVNETEFTGSIKTIGLLHVDLYIPILTYIFGQAYLSGKSGIASTYRLKNERYGMKPNELLLRERFIKEVIHELGHTFSLKHCHDPICVMRSSTYVEDLDQKSEHLCNNCIQNLQY